MSTYETPSETKYIIAGDAAMEDYQPNTGTSNSQPPQYNPKKTTLQRAQQVIDDREQKYGNPAEHWSEVAKRWSIVLRREVTPREAIQCMIELKLARENYKPSDENREDIAGYTELLERL